MKKNECKVMVQCELAYIRRQCRTDNVTTLPESGALHPQRIQHGGIDQKLWLCKQILSRSRKLDVSG